MKVGWTEMQMNLRKQFQDPAELRSAGCGLCLQVSFSPGSS